MLKTNDREKLFKETREKINYVQRNKDKNDSRYFSLETMQVKSGATSLKN